MGVLRKFHWSVDFTIKKYKRSAEYFLIRPTNGVTSKNQKVLLHSVCMEGHRRFYGGNSNKPECSNLHAVTGSFQKSQIGTRTKILFQ